VNQNKTVLITGGGNGIGRELCKCFHNEGYNLVVVSLLMEELISLREELNPLFDGQKIIIFQQDLSDTEAAESVYAFCEKNKIDIDILVNNVGFGLVGRHIDLDAARIEQMIILNMMTMTMLCHRFGKRMKERGSGHVLNVASTSAFQPLPFWAAYAATKAYVSSFSQSLAREMKEFGVAVTCLYPGTTATNFLDYAGLEKSSSMWSVGSLIHGAAMDAKNVARVGFRNMKNKKLRAIPGITNKIHFYFVYCIPNIIITAVVYVFMKRYKQIGL
jgi:short-subunit dehydrogenase